MKPFLIVFFSHLLALLLLTLATPSLIKEKKQNIKVICFDAVTRQPIITPSLSDEIDDEEIFFEPEPACAPEPEPAPSEPEIVEVSIPEPEPPPPPKPTPTPKPKPKPVAKKTPPQKKPIPPPKKKPKTVAKKTAPTPKPTPSSPKKQTDPRLLNLMKESLSKIDGVKKGSGGSKKTSSTSNSIGSLKSESLKDTEIAKLSYESELAIFLKHRLLLPEHGDVKIKLTLSDVGKVLSVATVSSLSEKNLAHVKEKLPVIVFPPFDERLEGQKSHTFSITLKSD